MKDKDFGKNSFIVLALTTFGSAVNYLCQILMGRALEVSEFGTINSIFSIMSITGVAGTTAGMLISKFLAEKLADQGEQEIRQYIVSVTRKLFVGGFLLVFIGAVLCVALNPILHVEDILLVLLTMVTVIVSLFPPYFQGVFGGLQKFFHLGIYTILVPVIKLLGVGSLFFVKDVNSVYYVVISVIIANLIAIAAGIIQTDVFIDGRILAFTRKISDSKFRVDRQFWEPFAVNICMMFMMNIDILYLKVYCGSEHAGYYSSAVLFGRIIYYCVTALGSVLLPMVSYANRSKESTWKMLKQTLLFTSVISVILLVPVNLFGSSILSLIYGSQYADAAGFLKYASLISVSISLNTILENYILGAGKLNFFLKGLCAGSAAVIVFVFIFKDNYALMLFTIGLIQFAIFIVNFLKCRYYELRK